MWMIREFPGFISFADHLDSSHYNDNQWQELLTKYQLFQESDAKYQTQGPQEGLDSLRLLHEISWIKSHWGRVHRMIWDQTPYIIIQELPSEWQINWNSFNVIQNRMVMDNYYTKNFFGKISKRLDIFNLIQTRGPSQYKDAVLPV